MKQNEQSVIVSIAMVAYNQQAFIERAIKGVIRQKTPFSIELIVVDDCSTDNTFALAKKWQDKYPDIIKAYRNDSNIGLQRNYLKAFSYCSGKYLALCDADDYWCDHSKLRRQVEYMESNPDCAITFHRVINHYAGVGTKSLSNGQQQVDTDISHLSRGNYITNCSVLYRKSLIDLNSLPSWFTSDIWPDYPTHLLFARYGSIHYMKRPMAVYRQGGGGMWTAAGEYARQEKALKVRKLLIQEFADNPQAIKGLKEAVRNILIAMVRTAPNARLKQQAVSELTSDYGLSTSQVQELVSQSCRKKSVFSQLMTTGRKIVSFLIPLPRP